MDRVLIVHCPDCSSELHIDVATGAVLEHRPLVAPSRTVDLDNAAGLLRRQAEERDNRFAQSVKAEKTRDEVLAKKFDQGMRRVRDNPNEPRPLRDMDLD